MGGAYCCKYKEKDPHDKNYGTPVLLSGDLLVNSYKKKENYIIKIQALTRGFLLRKIIRLSKEMVEAKP